MQRMLRWELHKLFLCGDEAKKSGLKENDYVLYDYFAVYQNFPDYVLIDVENIILQVTEEEANEYIDSYVIQ